MTKGRAAVFLDRDGVLNQLVFNPSTQEFESPHNLEDLKMITQSFKALERLGKRFELFVVSNQPSYAKGKTSLEEIKAIEAKLKSEIERHGVEVREYYYCYHHPEGIVPEFTMVCSCRKPKPYFLQKAATEFGIDLSHSWMVGDQDTDVQCGQAAGVKTVLITNKDSEKKRGQSKPDFTAQDVLEAADKILMTGE